MESPSAIANQRPPSGLCLLDASVETTVYIQSYGTLGKSDAAMATPAQKVVTASAYDHAAIFHCLSCFTVPDSQQGEDTRSK